MTEKHFFVEDDVIAKNNEDWGYDFYVNVPETFWQKIKNFFRRRK